MPTISSFYGINIKINLRGEHNPPHIHAEYNNYKATYKFSGVLLKGKMSKRQEKLIQAWLVIHQEELKQNWERMRKNEPLSKISPLK